jgi:hypothetical protein
MSYLSSYGFFIQRVTGTTAGYRRTLKSLLGELSLTSGQAERLGVDSHSQLSPGLAVCGLRVSANVSYQHAAEDVEVFTGIRISAATQQRLVHRHTFAPPQLEQPVQELMAVDYRLGADDLGDKGGADQNGDDKKNRGNAYANPAAHVKFIQWFLTSVSACFSFS